MRQKERQTDRRSAKHQAGRQILQKNKETSIADLKYHKVIQWLVDVEETTYPRAARPAAPGENAVSCACYYWNPDSCEAHPKRRGRK